MDQQFGAPLDPDDPAFAEQNGRFDREQGRERLQAVVSERLDAKKSMFRDMQAESPELVFPTFHEIARAFLLQTLDQQWKDHLLAMDHLKEGVGLRGYGGQDPKREYQREGYELFLQMNDRVREHHERQRCQPSFRIF